MEATMSFVHFHDDVLFTQRLLAAERLYLGALDGLWGPITERAYQEFSLRTAAITKELGAFDTRSEQNICSLSLRTQRVCRIFLARVLEGGIRVRVISGTRTYKEQDELFRHGRYGNPGPRVTNARGGRSNHNFGIAWDIGIFTEEGGYITQKEDYDEAARIGLTPEIEWGGFWKNFPDRPHYQLRFKQLLSIATLREHFEEGETIQSYA